jgi:hypothetical protein
MASLAVLAGIGGLLASDLAEQRFCISATAHIQYALSVSLLGCAKSRLYRQLLADGAIEPEVLASYGTNHLCSRLTRYVARERGSRDWMLSLRVRLGMSFRRHGSVRRRVRPSTGCEWVILRSAQVEVAVWTAATIAIALVLAVAAQPRLRKVVR